MKDNRNTKGVFSFLTLYMVTKTRGKNNYRAKPYTTTNYPGFFGILKIYNSIYYMKLGLVT